MLGGIGGEELAGRESAAILVPLQVAGACLAVVCFLKGKTASWASSGCSCLWWRLIGTRAPGRSRLEVGTAAGCTHASLTACRAPRSP